MWSSLIVLAALGLASSCDSNCLDCSDTGDCLSCDLGLYPSGPNCLTCQSEPVICTNLDVNTWSCYCTSTSTSTRLAAAPGPSSHCSLGYSCYVCTSGACLNALGKCVTCPTQSAGCLSVDSYGNCANCGDGYYPNGFTCSACNSKCDKCKWAEVCTHCVEPYLLVDNYCCDPKCVSCGLDKCWQCKTGSLLASGACEACPANCGGCPDGICDRSSGTAIVCSDFCDKCSSSTYCDTCFSGYYSRIGVCKKCNSRCKVCEWSESCSVCADDYHVVNGYCCDAGCTSCIFEKCWECTSGYLFEDNLCKACPADCGGCPNGICNKITCPTDCLSCTSSTWCDKCVDGKRWDGRQCTPCNLRCSKCDYEEVCTDCVGPYVLIDNYCCDPQCASCKFEKCWKCKSGSLLKPDATCGTCPSNCGGCPDGACDGSGSGSSVTCSDGYFLDAGSCTKCNSRCTTCKYPEVCTGCVTGFEEIDGYCCDPQCASCKFEKCWKCKSGSLLQADATCGACPSNCGGCPDGFCDTPIECPADCTSCSSSTIREVCKTGYYLTENGCTRCNSRCSSCIWSANCDACNEPYVPKFDFCCPAGCSSCNPDICWGCEDNYLFENYQCVPCPSTCTSCTKGTCDGPTVCPTGCSKCSSSTVCTGCTDGYYLAGVLCTLCNPRCKICESSEVCSECNSPFTLQNNFCCEPGCSSCNPLQCHGCLDGYLFKDFSCITCPNDCKSCTAGVCDGPKNCIEGCDVCYTLTTCSECKTGYYIGNYICNRCNPRCSKCIWSDNCIECVSPYVQKGVYCCPAGCTSCNWDKCTGCDEGL